MSIPLSCMVAYDIYREMQETVAHTKTSLRTLVQMMVSNTGGKIEHARRSLELLAERPLVKRMSSTSCDPALKDFHYLSPDYTNVVYTDVDGTTVCSAVPQPGGKPVSVGTMPWFRKFLEEKHFMVGSPHFGPITGKWVSVLSAPIRDDNGELVGAIHLPLDLSAYDPGIPSQYLPKGSRYGFVDKSGVLIWRNQDPDHSIGRLPKTDTGRAIIQTRDGELVSTPADGIPRFYSVKPVPGTDWIAFVGVPVSTIQAEARAVAWRAAMVALSVMAVLTLLAFRIARSITKPIAGLAKVAHAVHGDVSGKRAAVTGPPEVATVAREFNAMLDSLGRQDAQLRAFLNNSAVIAWLQDGNGRYVFASNNFLNRMKLTADQVIGKTNYDICPRDLADAYRNNDQQILTSGRPMEFIEQGIEPDGTVSWWLSHKFLFDEPGGKRFLGGLSVDITKRKQAADRDEQILKSTMDGFWLIDDTGVLKEVNETACAMLGYTQEEMLALRVTDIDAVHDEAAFEQRLQDLRRAGKCFFESRHRRKDGDEISVEISAGYLPGEKVFPVFVRDVTARKLLEHQLLQSQKMEAIGQLAGGVAHDFNNILTVIIGYANLLGYGGELSQSQSEAANRIIDASEKAAQLTKGLLAFSRKQVLNVKRNDLIEVVRHVQSFLARIIGEDIRLDMINHEATIPVQVDGGQIEQVLINLAANARDAMPGGGVLTIETGTVEISSDAEVADHILPGRYAFLSVSDTGCGMDEATRSKIFEPFFTTKEVGKGTGLGMSIVYGIVQQHNGSIEVLSEPGKGTTFKILLPSAEENQDGVEENTGPVPEEILRGEETVLLVEDEESVRELVTKVLARYGYRVLQSSDGREAVAMFRAHRDEVALVVMDMIMPGMNGKAAYEEIRKERPGTKVLYLSGYTADFIKDRGVSEEVIDLVMKPVQPTELLKKVRELLDS
ncbi:PAS domain S-box protein [Geomonas anaerohicana]|uniref:histidine kinase n=1 Tax=Geomonas anaerohicana TaxID=2798583 RepID=A0ABS0YIH1_9BACT|nr:PAS domain S-box protein [Geomonas anaerohicana]MBJ6752095.1 PAS domain S-box protein [Geomonas anaerohicana]